FFEAHVRPLPVEGIAGKRCLAFAGIGDPGKFFDTVAALGGEVTMAKPFGDHHFYSEFDAQDLLSTADAQGLELVTTAKDAVRLDHGGAAIEELKRRARIVEIETVLDIESAPCAIVSQTVEGWRLRRPDKALRDFSACAGRGSSPARAPARPWRWHRAPAGRRSSISGRRAGSDRR